MANKAPNIEEIKKKMKEYKDYFGQSLLGLYDIDNCNDLEGLKDIIDNHEEFLERQCNDAQSQLERFSRSLGLNSI